MARLVQDREFPPEPRPELGDDFIFRYCTFENLTRDRWGFSVEATFLECTFRNEEFLDVLFNCALFHKCNFEGCSFLGASISGCTFVDCTFTSTVVGPDHDGIPTTFEGSRWFGCKQANCTGLDWRRGTTE